MIYRKSKIQIVFITIITFIYIFFVFKNFLLFESMNKFNLITKWTTQKINNFLGNNGNSLNEKIIKLNIYKKKYKTIRDENKNLKSIIGIGIKKNTYTYASIISYKNNNGFFIIDKGNKNKIKPKMVVYGKNGIIGYVVNSYEHYSQVVPITSSKINVPIKIDGNLGFLKGKNNLKPQIRLEENNNPKDLYGKNIYTSGLCNILPANICIGYVNKNGDSSLLDNIYNNEFVKVSIG